MTRKPLPAIVLIAAVLLAGCGSDESTTTATEASQTPSEPVSEAPERDGSYDLDCDYLLGDGLNDYRFVGGGTITNEGNIGIEVEVIFRWEQLGSDPVEERLDERLEVGQRKRVNVTVPVSGDQIDAHQSADSKCSAKANIVGQFGPVS